MIRKMKTGKDECSSLMAIIGRQSPTKSLDLNLPKAFKGSRIKLLHRNTNNYITSFDNQTDRPIFSLKESITVRRIQLSSQSKCDAQSSMGIKAICETEMQSKITPDSRRNAAGAHSSFLDKLTVIKEKTSSCHATPKHSSLKKELPSLLRLQVMQTPRFIKVLPKIGIKEAIRNTD